MYIILVDFNSRKYLYNWTFKLCCYCFSQLFFII